MYHQPLCDEATRSIITKYRTGSHNLRIQVGRRNRENRGERLCTCGDNIQTLEHVLFNCRFTKNIKIVYGLQHTDLNKLFENENYMYTINILKSVEDILEI